MKPKPIPYPNGFRVNFARRGKRYRARFRIDEYTNPRQAAEEYIDKVLTDGTTSRGEPLDKVIDKYITWGRRSQNKASGTIKIEIQRLGVFSTWYRGQVSEISKQTIRDFQTHFFDNFPLATGRRQRKVDNPQATWNRYRATLSPFFNWATSRGLMRANPLDRAKEFTIPLHEKIPDRIFTADELDSLFEHFDGFNVPEISAFYRLLAYTGMRLNEATELKWNAVDLKTGVIRITRSKTRTVRSIPIHPVLKPYLTALRRREYVFESPFGGRYFSGNAWWQKLKEATLALRIPRARVHDFRHTFAANLAMQSVPLATIAKLLGHTTTVMTARYLHFYPEHLRSAVNALSF